MIGGSVGAIANFLISRDPEISGTIGLDQPKNNLSTSCLCNNVDYSNRAEQSRLAHDKLHFLIKYSTISFLETVS